jgi:diacylglycerol kinase family enzyme
MPHPGITYRRTAADQVEFSNPTRIRLDGEDVGHATHLSVRVETDALRLVV